MSYERHRKIVKYLTVINSTSSLEILDWDYWEWLCIQRRGRRKRKEQELVISFSAKILKPSVLPILSWKINFPWKSSILSSERKKRGKAHPVRFKWSCYVRSVYLSSSLLSFSSFFSLPRRLNAKIQNYASSRLGKVVRFKQENELDSSKRPIRTYTYIYIHV